MRSIYYVRQHDISRWATVQSKQAQPACYLGRVRFLSILSFFFFFLCGPVSWGLRRSVILGCPSRGWLQGPFERQRGSSAWPPAWSLSDMPSRAEGLIVCGHDSPPLRCESRSMSCSRAASPHSDETEAGDMSVEEMGFCILRTRRGLAREGG